MLYEANDTRYEGFEHRLNAIQAVLNACAPFDFVVSDDSYLMKDDVVWLVQQVCDLRRFGYAPSRASLRKEGRDSIMRSLADIIAQADNPQQVAAEVAAGVQGVAQRAAPHRPRRGQPGARSGVMKYRKKPVVIEAMQWDGSAKSLRGLARWANAHPGINLPGEEGAEDEPWIDWVAEGTDDNVHDVQVHTLEGSMGVSPGDYVIRGVKGEFYPCKPDIFEATYEPEPDGAA